MEGIVVTNRLWAIFLVAALLTPSSQAASQTDAAQQETEEWACNVSDPNAADPDFIFESHLRIVDKDLRLYWTRPPKPETGPGNVERRYTLVINSDKTAIGMYPVQDGPTPEGWGYNLLLLNKASGLFRSGGMVIGGFYTHAVGHCSRK
jgi:hypothetical protein